MPETLSVFTRNRLRETLLLLIALLFGACCVQARTIIIEHDLFIFDEEKAVHLYTNPRVTIDNIHISSNRLRYDKNADMMNFYENIIIRTAGALLTAESATVDLEKSIITLHKATMFDEVNGMFVEASQIERVEEDKFIIYNGSISICKPQEKAWELRGRRITYYVDNFAYSLSTSFHFYKLPLFYTPFFSWPTRKGRSSGFLPPNYITRYGGNKSFSYGARVQIPYFLALDLDHDLTVTADIIQERGMGIGLDYQYAFFPGMRGEVKTWYIDESQKDRDLDKENLGSLGAGGLDRQPTRYKYQINHRQNFFWNGQLFFHQHLFGDGQLDNEYFDDSFTIHDHYEQTLSMVFPLLSGSFSIYYETGDNFEYASIYDTQTNADTALNKHPSVKISQRFSGLFDSPLSMNLDGGFTNYERKKGWNAGTSTGNIKLSAPFFINFLNVNPSVNRAFFDYQVSYRGARDESVRSYPKRFGWHIDEKNLELSFEIFRLFLNTEQVATRKISIQPRIVYKEISDVDQSLASGSGFADELVGSQKNISYILNTSLLTKNPATNVVRTFFTLSLTQIYDLQREGDQEFDSPQPRYPETEPGDTKLPLRINFSLAPVPGFSADLFYRYDHKSEEIVETNISLGVASSEWSSFSLGYKNNTKTYTELDDTLKAKINSYEIIQSFKLNDQWAMSMRGVWDLARNELDYQFSEVKRLNRELTYLGVSLTYNHSCYSFTAGYSEEISEATVQTVRGVETEYLDQRVTLTLSFPVLPTSTSENTTVPYSQQYLLNR